EVPEVRAGEARARRARATFVEWTWIPLVESVTEVHAAGGRQRGTRATHPGRQDAVKDVDPPLDHLEDTLGIADAHEVPGPVRREARRGVGDGLEHGLAALAHGEPPERVAVEADIDNLLERAPAELWVRRALGDPEEQLARRPRRRGLTARPERRQPGVPLELGARSAGRRAHVKAHRDVGSERRLDARCALRSEARRLAVVDRAKR